MQLTVHMFQTFDGVVQSPGSPEEDPRDGFTRGGWIVPFNDAEFGAVVESWLVRAEEILLGRFTFEAMRAYWPQVTDPDNGAATTLNGRPKHLVSRTVTDPAWANTSVISADVLDAVAALKQRPGGELQVHGSGRLVAALYGAGLVDEFRVLTFPVVVGSGRRLFGEGTAASGFQVVDRAMTTTGVSYHALRPVPIEVGGFVVEDGREKSVPVD